MWPRLTVHQNLNLHTIGKNATKIFPYSTHCVITKSPERLEKECVAGSDSWRSKRRRFERQKQKLQDKLQSRVSNFVSILTLRRRDSKCFYQAIEKLTTNNVEENCDHVFRNLYCATKVNLAFGMNLKIVETGNFRFFYFSMPTKTKRCQIHRDFCVPETLRPSWTKLGIK